jgi:predicted DCC family thiol-disulfide oxidoreductase YuxK
MKNNKQLVILFDGSCHFCTATAQRLRVLDWQHRLHGLPFQAPGVPQAYGLTVAQGERVVWAISPDSSGSPRAQAASAVLDASVDFPFFRLLYQVPGLRPIEDNV